MRLLGTKNTQTLLLREFSQATIPNYAILSHRWEEEEVTLHSIHSGTFATMKGFSKLAGCCERASTDGYDWIWVDTCCIDKTSSAELSEAINSMYRWYQNSSVCYVYLSDIDDVSDLQKSLWFSRGWTLQELIAPSHVILFDKFWRRLGAKHEARHMKRISFITGIPTEVISGASPFQCNVAERMSWASERSTSREEDMAYCLMGLFDVHITPIYGEGSEKAFLRLQEEILRRTSDQTLFLWTQSHDPCNLGLLATSPKAFCTHYDCFPMFDGYVHLKITDSFNPYRWFVPMNGAAQSIVSNATGGRPRYGPRVEVEPASLGANGLQISLLCDQTSYNEGSMPLTSLLNDQTSFTETNSSSAGHQIPDTENQPTITALDVCFVDNRYHQKNLLLHLTPEPIVRQPPERFGALRRFVHTHHMSGICMKTYAPNMTRRRISISQVHGDGFGGTATFKLESSDIRKRRVKGAVIFGSHEYPRRDGKRVMDLSKAFHGVGGCVLLDYTSKSSDVEERYVIAFGTRGQRSEPWITFAKTSATHITDDSIKDFYCESELLSVRFKQHAQYKRPCGWWLKLKIHPDMIEKYHVIRISTSEQYDGVGTIRPAMG